MRGRGKGRILQLGSTAAHTSLPQTVVYSSTKLFMLDFAKALTSKPRDSGVTVVVLCPGTTDTDCCEHGGAEYTPAVQGPLADSKDVARDGYKALMNGGYTRHLGPRQQGTGPVEQLASR